LEEEARARALGAKGLELGSFESIQIITM